MHKKALLNLILTKNLNFRYFYYWKIKNYFISKNKNKDIFIKILTIM